MKFWSTSASSTPPTVEMARSSGAGAVSVIGTARVSYASSSGSSGRDGPIDCMHINLHKTFSTPHGVRGLAERAKGGDADYFHGAPRLTPRRRLDETAAARNPILRWNPPAS